MIMFQKIKRVQWFLAFSVIKVHHLNNFLHYQMTLLQLTCDFVSSTQLFFKILELSDEFLKPAYFKVEWKH